MRNMLMLLGLLAFAGTGCSRFVVRTKVGMDGPIDTRVTDLSPVSPVAGPHKPVVVENGSAGRVAILDVDGLILNTPFVGPMSLGENPVAIFREKLNAIEGDKCVRAVVLRVNSHGGGVAACQAMRRDLEKFKIRTGKPVVACLLDTATGGAYHLASACDQIIASDSTVTGGLGVLLNLYNLEDTMALMNVRTQMIKAGEKVDIGTSTKPLKPEDRKILQAMADEFDTQMLSDIGRMRPTIREAIDLAKITPELPELFRPPSPVDGRIFTASKAKEFGLVDQIGDMDTAMTLAASMSCPNGGVLKGHPQAVLYRRNNDPANSVYAVSANIPLHGAGLFPNLPGLERSKLPTFLSMWQPDITMEKLGGK